MDKSGPAFPTTPARADPDQSYVDGGISIRDYFAIRVLNGLLSHSAELNCESTTKEGIERERANFRKHISNMAYLYADAMLEARK